MSTRAPPSVPSSCSSRSTAYAGTIGEACELIGQRNIHVAIRSLGELRQFRRLGRSHRPDLGGQEAAVQGDAAGLAGGAEAAHELGVGGEVAEDAAAVDALGAEDAE